MIILPSGQPIDANQVKSFLYAKLIKPLLGFLSTGISPAKLSMGIAWGVTLGVIPFIGINTILCALVAFVFRINMGVIQLVNYFVYPLQLILFLPFIKLGTSISGNSPLPYPMEEIWGRLQLNFLDTIGEIWWANLLGVGIWLIVAPILYVFVYLISKYLIDKFYTGSNQILETEFEKDELN